MMYVEGVRTQGKDELIIIKGEEEEVNGRNRRVLEWRQKEFYKNRKGMMC